MTVDRHPYRRQHVELVDEDRDRIILREMDRVLQFITPIILALPSASIGVAPANASYVTLSHTSSLSSERVLTGTADQIVVTDNGPDSTVVLSSPLVGHPYVTIGNVAGLTGERALTGTANQITVTDGGANGAVTLSTPQNLHTATIFQVAQLGIGAAPSSSPAVHLDVTGRMRFVPVVQSFAVSQTNYDIGGSTVLRLTASNPGLVIRGFTNGIDGRVVIIINAGATNSFGLIHDATATAANRFFNSSLQTIVLSPGSSKLAVYDGTLLRWRVSDWMTPDGQYNIIGAFTWQSTLVVDADAGGLLQILKNGAPQTQFKDSGTGNTLLFGPASLSGATTLSLPDATDTLVARATTDNLSNKTFITLTTFDTTGGNTGQIRLKGDSAGNLPFLEYFNLTGSSTMHLVPTTISGSSTLQLPDTTDTLVARNTTEMLQNKTLQTNCSANATSQSSGFAIQDSTTATKKLRWDLSGAAGSNAFVLVGAGARAYTYKTDADARVQTSGDTVVAAAGTVTAGFLGKLDSTGNTATVAATTLANAVPAGFYRLSWYVKVTTAGDIVATDNLTITCAWNDGTAQTATLDAEDETTLLSVLPVSTLNRAFSGRKTVYVAAAQNISITATLVNAGATNPVYDFRARLEAI